MKEIEAGNYWCPMGRISIQQGSDKPHIEVVKCGAFNRAIIYAPGSQDQGQASYPSRCLGVGCACWEWGFFSDLGLVPSKLRRGRCGLCARSQAIVPLWALSIGAALSVYFLHWAM